MLSLRKSLARAEAERDAYRAEAEAAAREADRLSSEVAIRDAGRGPREAGATFAGCCARLKN